MPDDKPDLAGWDRDRDGLMADYEHLEVGFDLIPYDADKPSRPAAPPGGARQRTMLANDVMLRLPAALAQRGGQVFEVEGWQYRGASGRPMADTIYGSISHWIVSELKPGKLHENQTLGVIVNGTSKLDGPLANLYLAWDGRIGVVAGGRANHGGEGSWNGVSGNQYWVGTEAEGPEFTKAQVAAYAIIVCAVADVTGQHPRDWAISHQEYAPGRKQDIGKYIELIRTNAIAMYEKEADDMAQVPQEQWNQLFNMVKFNYDATLYEPGGYGFPEANNNVLNEVKSLTTKVIELLTVPGQGYTWDHANSNKLDGLVTQLEAISAIGSDGSVDVNALATRLAEILPGEVKKALGEALLQ